MTVFDPAINLADICARLDWREIFGIERRWSSISARAMAAFHSRTRSCIRNQSGSPLSACSAASQDRDSARSIWLGNVRVLRLEFGYFVKYILPPDSVSVAQSCFPIRGPSDRHWPRA